MMRLGREGLDKTNFLGGAKSKVRVFIQNPIGSFTTGAYDMGRKGKGQYTLREALLRI
jgi:hypothetical protein